MTTTHAVLKKVIDIDNTAGMDATKIGSGSNDIGPTSSVLFDDNGYPITGSADAVPNSVSSDITGDGIMDFFTGSRDAFSNDAFSNDAFSNDAFSGGDAVIDTGIVIGDDFDKKELVDTAITGAADDSTTSEMLNYIKTYGGAAETILSNIDYYDPDEDDDQRYDETRYVDTELKSGSSDSTSDSIYDLIGMTSTTSTSTASTAAVSSATKIDSDVMSMLQSDDAKIKTTLKSYGMFI